ncbi:DUF1499 domain-containing protein [Vibrio sp. SM6]|uniref:DUF1499 domain-containing protein n=1 Tax=Vibrio agarilyticus TaxID=2726741 RepID=A0A7X8YFU7_9VIBR|nr:DUF1499 domain-containing protein [Vibrio agarilyticus]NLS12278.1 DUF1499 domain-containing protein [Vibrio agarilyticus]
MKLEISKQATLKLTAQLSVILLTISTTACAQGDITMDDRTALPCGNKPNCVSTEDSRADHHLAPFILQPGTTLKQVEAIALTLPGAKLAVSNDGYLRVECTSKWLKFVDDLEIRLDGQQMQVRSESRVGYSDFGVNRKRTEQLRQGLSQAGLLML